MVGDERGAAPGSHGRAGVRPYRAANGVLPTGGLRVIVLDDRRTTAGIDARPLTGRDMLCFSHDWSGDPLSKTHLMKLLARDNRILWVNSIGYRAPTATAADVSRAWRKLKAAAAPMSEPVPNLHVLNPLAVPAWGSAAVRAVN